MNKKDELTDFENPKLEKLTEEQLIDAGMVDTDLDLGDEQRVKVMSPGMLVARRFVRNKLAIAGTVILLIMFVFSFIGGFITPYTETEVFKYQGTMEKEYVYATLSSEIKFYTKEGMDYDSGTHARFILEKNKGNEYFDDEGITYKIIQEGEDFYNVQQGVIHAQITDLRGILTISPSDDFDLSADLTAKIEQSMATDEREFVHDSIEYSIVRSGREYSLISFQDAALETMLIVDPLLDKGSIDYDFYINVQRALAAGDISEITVDDKTYTLQKHKYYSVISTDEDVPYAIASEFSVNPAISGEVVSMEFRDAMHEAIDNDESHFALPDDPETEYSIKRLNNVYTIKKESTTELINIQEPPSKEHWLGTNAHGMDNVTRLMYGGRISLSIGFVVVAIEIILGIILGGLAGYFGKWVDMLLMRIVDIFNCIPFLPLLIILGSIMDNLEVDPKIRIYYMMLTLGIMSWPGIARVVRGQILSLREQEFMIAAEASGLAVSKRIFKHLVPNVIPQLIVFATLGLGGIIIYESTLSFLGLGVKFPYASWGNIISGITTSYEMTNFWYSWIPAGLSILITVLGFNFVGDGLRDAYDPKMKR